MALASLFGNSIDKTITKTINKTVSSTILKLNPTLKTLTHYVKDVVFTVLLEIARVLCLVFGLFCLLVWFFF